MAGPVTSGGNEDGDLPFISAPSERDPHREVATYGRRIGLDVEQTHHPHTVAEVNECCHDGGQASEMPERRVVVDTERMHDP